MKRIFWLNVVLVLSACGPATDAITGTLYPAAFDLNGSLANANGVDPVQAADVDPSLWYVVAQPGSTHRVQLLGTILFAYVGDPATAVACTLNATVGDGTINDVEAETASCSLVFNTTVTNKCTLDFEITGAGTYDTETMKLNGHGSFYEHGSPTDCTVGPRGTFTWELRGALRQ